MPGSAHCQLFLVGSDLSLQFKGLIKKIRKGGNEERILHITRQYIVLARKYKSSRSLTYDESSNILVYEAEVRHG